MKIVLTGGGSAGHVMVNLALMPHLRKMNLEVHYLGSREGIEKKLVAPFDVNYHAISTGKWRRYFSWQNLVDLFKLVWGIGEALVLLYRIKPKVVFSKGGFVSVPVVLASWCLRIPVVVHEADLDLGLANRIALPLAAKFCTSFLETLKSAGRYSSKMVYTGLPLRADLLEGSSERGRFFLGFQQDKKILLVMGGSLGAKAINEVVDELLPALLERYYVVHLRGGEPLPLFRDPSYRAFTYLNKELADVLAVADLVVSRAGANAVQELITLGKLNILIPLSRANSRGDQLLNARYVVQQGYSKVIEPEELTPQKLWDTLITLEKEAKTYRRNLATYHSPPALELILKEIKAFLV